ncbi:MAG: hypothetical protein OIF56_02950 [Cohaesibacter sp.]|nr:hypothetical protein [Cohaesibacter sp.]MCV6602379.1 hypothetical protein [Cohaesibacter sp.]
MDFALLAAVIFAALFSPLGIAAFISGMLIKQRWHATLSAAIFATIAFISTPNITTLPFDRFTQVIVGTMIGMMIAAHLSFAIKKHFKSKAKQNEKSDA